MEKVHLANKNWIIKMHIVLVKDGNPFEFDENIKELFQNNDSIILTKNLLEDKIFLKRNVTDNF